ncbi:MAG: putative metal-binding motif-containing protein [Kofleriaceae bacterium]
MRAIVGLLGVVGMGMVGMLGAGCSEQGANLVFSAPAGPATASSYEIVLASTDLVPVIGDQRVSPTALTSETVTYYLQRAAANASGSIDKVEGFRVLVEPNATVADTAFIPFVLLYDDQDKLVGAGTYRADASGAPSPIVIPHGAVDEYPITIDALAEVVDTQPVAAGDAMQVTCDRADQSTFRSGVVWRDAAGAELRLMLPDGDSDDATARALDLDCDGAVVAAATSSGDCDDTRARFHAGATEVCNGEDTRCDGLPYLVVPCTPTGATGTCANANSGVAICEQATQMTTGCVQANACVCAASPGDTACRHCVVTFGHGTTAGSVMPCQPAIDATVNLGTQCAAASCTVTVLGTRDGWTAAVAASLQSSFGPAATGVTGTFALRVARPPGDLAGGAGSLVGAVDFALTAPGQPPRLFSYELELATDGVTTCTGNGPYTMTCTP